MPESTRLPCAVCSDPVDPNGAHSLHETDCAKSHSSGDPDSLCGCDAVAHPDCCPELQCQDIGTGRTIEVTARFAVPPWFNLAQANALGRCLVQFFTWREQPLHEGYGPAPEAWYGYDSAYISAASAEARTVNRSTLDASAILWGHGDRCKACRHVDDDHSLDGTAGCAVEGCKCARWVPYGRLADIRGVRS